MNRRVEGLSTSGSVSGAPARRVWVVSTRWTADALSRRARNCSQPADIGSARWTSSMPTSAAPGPLVSSRCMRPWYASTGSSVGVQSPSRTRRASDVPSSIGSLGNGMWPTIDANTWRTTANGVEDSAASHWARPTRRPRSTPILRLALSRAVLPVPGRPSITIGLPWCSQVPDSTWRISDSASSRCSRREPSPLGAASRCDRIGRGGGRVHNISSPAGTGGLR